MNVRAILVCTALAVSFAVPAQAQPSRPDVLEVISLRGVIDSGMAASVSQAVEAINDNKRVKAVFIEVDSPGGGVLASAAIYDELSRLKVPVVGWCDNLCASGGMYALMAPSVKYIAIRTDVTISGSIGVISQAMRFNRLLDYVKVDVETYKSGSRKDEGNGTRAAEDQEKKNLQAMIDELAGKFYAVVEKGRGNKITDWNEVKSARIFFGQSGVKVGLVDEVMTRDSAMQKAKALSGSKNIYTKDELKKMSSQASDPSSPFASAPDTPMLAAYAKDIAFVMETAREIKDGGFLRFEYRMPAKF